MVGVSYYIGDVYPSYYIGDVEKLGCVCILLYWCVENEREMILLAHVTL